MSSFQKKNKEQKAIQLFKEGYRRKEIMSLLGVPYSTLCRWFQENKLQANTSYKFLKVYRENTQCPVCNKEFLPKARRREKNGPLIYQKYCSQECQKYGRRKWRSRAGYALNYEKYNGHRVFYSHTIKAERALGRKLGKNEVVHHIDGDKSNDKNSNLLICPRGYHKWLHDRMSYLYQRKVLANKA
jgi:hypothetical protein